MAESFNLVTLNINNITNQTKLDALQNFLRVNEVDIAFLQEVENNQITLSGYTMLFNVDHRKRGVAIALGRRVEHEAVENSLDGRLIVVRLKNGTTLCNIYAPTGSQNRNAREDFFNTTCAHYLRNVTGPIILGGDFNSIVNDRDATGGTPRSEMTSRLMLALNLIDVWRCLHPRDTDYTFVRAGCGSRLDRFLVSKSTREWLRTARHVATCFSDHKALLIRMSLPRTGQTCGRGLWRLNAHVLDDEETLSEFARKWQYWITQRRNYTSWLTWWIQFAKPKIRSFLKWRSSLQYRDFRDTFELLNGELSRAYNLHLNGNNQLVRINRIKGLMLQNQREHSNRCRLLHETFLQGESTSLFHVAQKMQNRQGRTINELDADGTLIREGIEIEQTIVNYFETLFSATPNTTPVTGFEPTRRIPDNVAANNDLLQPVDENEIIRCIKNSCPRKSPGDDGLPREFYYKTWNIISTEFTSVINDALRNPDTDSKFMNGVVVLVKKKQSGNSVKAYRPITLLNFDYKILTRVIKNRMIPLADHVLSQHQKCSNGKHNIFEATTQILDKIASLKHGRQSAMLVSFDMDHAFDRVKYDFLYHTLTQMNFNPQLIDFLRKIYGNSFSNLLINGKLSRPFQIRRSVRQGDPLSMLLFVLYIQPLVDRLATNGAAGSLLNVYADDISLIVSEASDLAEAVNKIREFEAVSGAVLNLAKTTALKIGNPQTDDVDDCINFKESLKILGLTFTDSVKQSIDATWQSTLKNLKWRLWMCKSRKLNLLQKVIHLNTFVSSKIWYAASTFPLPKKYEKAILKEYRNFLWIGNKQPIRLDTLFLPKERGGLNLHSPGLKSIALLTNRMLANQTLLPFFSDMLGNTPVLQIPPAFPQIKIPALEISTLPPQIIQQHSSSGIYQELIQGESNPTILETRRQWKRIFKNLADQRLDSSLRANWYMVIHGKIQHNDLLYRQRRRYNPDCNECRGVVKTLEHKLFKCVTVRSVWTYARSLLGNLDPRLRSKNNDYFMFPSLQGLSGTVIQRTKMIIAKYLHFVVSNPISSINVDNFKLEL